MDQKTEKQKSSLEALCKISENKNKNNEELENVSSGYIYNPIPRFKLYSSSYPYIKRQDSENRRYCKQLYSAGILPFYVKNNNVYILLGKDSEGSWSDFGGRAEGQDQGRWDITAVREFYEESIGSVMEIPIILSLIQNKKNCLRLKGKTLNKSPYFMYFVKIPFRDHYRENFKSTLKFINYAKVFDKKFNEKSDIQWVSLDTMCASLDKANKDIINYPLREVFKDTFENNLDSIKQFGSKFFEEKTLLFRRNRS